MRFVAVLLACLCLLGSVPAMEADRSVVVWWPEEHMGEWWLPFAVHGQHGVARFRTVEEARMLYSVMAAVMVGGEGRR